MRIGIIGYGSIGKVHAQNVLDLGHKVTILDPAYSAKNERDFLAESEAIVVASPSNDHAWRILCNGMVFPMLVEKPIGINKSDVIEIEAILKRTDRVIMTANNMRYHPVVKEVKKHLNDIGAISVAHFVCLQKNTKYTDPVILNWGAHEADLALYLFGNAKLAPGSEISQNKAEFTLDHAQVKSGISLDYVTDPQERGFVILGSKGFINANIVRFEVSVRTEHGKEIIAVPGSHADSYKEEMQEFIRRIEGREPDGIGASGQDGVRCLRLLLEAQKVMA